MTDDRGILIRNIFYMLTYAFQDLRHNNYEDIAGEKFDHILDLFAEILFKGVSFQLKRGLHKSYVTHTDNIPTVRGKIDISNSMRLMKLNKMMMACEFDEFSEDNIHNRILKTTIIYLSASPDVKTARKRKLRNLLLFFSNVNSCNIKKVRWNDISYDRNTSTYRMLHHFCFFVAQRMILTTDSGPFKSRNFEDAMLSKLFEKFVLSYYRRHYPQHSARSAKVEWDIDVAASTTAIIPEMRTDIMLSFPTRTLIIDTKYYSRSMQEYMGKTAIHSSNLYQINSYVLHEDKGHAGNIDGMLLYARTQEEITPEGHMKLSDGNTIYFRNLDLNQPFADIRHQLDSYVAIECKQ